MVRKPDLLEVHSNWLLLTRSGEVGRVTAVYDEHLDKIVTDDLLRIEPNDSAELGWLYAYMRTPTFFAMTRSSQYGHMIKHLEPAHVDGLPVLMPDESVRRAIGADALRAIDLRRESRRSQHEAYELYAAQVNATVSDTLATFTVRASDLFGGRRRLDGEHYRADATSIEQAIRQAATQGVARLADLTESITLGNRFKRFFSETGGGTPYRSASELFDVNAPVTKRIFAALLDNPDRYMLHGDWIIMACSGQTYGLLGRTMVTTSAHEGVFGSHDLIRIVPDVTKARVGYLHTVLSHPELGRPLAIRNAYGTSIPHLDPIDVRDIPIPRFAPGIEDKISDLSERAIALAHQADILETGATNQAEALIEAALAQGR